MKGSFLSSQCEYELRVLYMGRWQFLTWEVHLLLGFCFHLLLFCFFQGRLRKDALLEGRESSEQRTVVLKY